MPASFQASPRRCWSRLFVPFTSSAPARPLVAERAEAASRQSGSGVDARRSLAGSPLCLLAAEAFPSSLRLTYVLSRVCAAAASCTGRLLSNRKLLNGARCLRGVPAPSSLSAVLGRLSSRPLSSSASCTSVRISIPEEVRHDDCELARLLKDKKRKEKMKE